MGDGLNNNPATAFGDDLNYDCLITERIKRQLFLSESRADVYFLIDNGGKVRLPAHRLILSISSPVFNAMFYGLMSGHSEETIEILDIDQETFKRLLQFIYTDFVQLSEISDAISLLYAAKKYQINRLIGTAVEFIRTRITTDNCVELLPQLRYLDEKELEESCLELIDKNPKELLTRTVDRLASLNRDLIKDILTRDTLSISEIDAFNLLLHWGQVECEKVSREPNTDNLRAIIGDLIYVIRFPLILSKQFTEQIADRGILSRDDCILLYKYYTATLAGPDFPFATQERVSFSAANANFASRMMDVIYDARSKATDIQVLRSFSRLATLEDVKPIVSHAIVTSNSYGEIAKSIKSALYDKFGGSDVWNCVVGSEKLNRGALHRPDDEFFLKVGDLFVSLWNKL